MSFRKIQLITAGESHGPAATAVLQGLPSQLALSQEDLQLQMKRRQLGYGRGGRMKIETDQVEITAGVRFGKTTGAPVCLVVKNLDYPNWEDVMSVWGPEENRKVVHRPRPGHADLPGGQKYGEKDLRNILERASARETVARTAAGSLCRQLLSQLGIEIASHVLSVGAVHAGVSSPDWESLKAIQNSDKLRCLDARAEAEMIAQIDEAKKRRETLGGIFEVIARNVPAGLGSHIQWDQKLDGRIAHAFLSIPAVKGVAIGDAFQIAQTWGSEAHDEIFYETGKGFTRRTNRSGGTEGGITTGQDLRIRAAMKPLSTLMKPMQSVDVVTKEAQEAVVERSDVCSVPAAGVVGEAMLALVLADAILEKFSSDSMSELAAAYSFYVRGLANY